MKNPRLSNADAPTATAAADSGRPVSLRPFQPVLDEALVAVQAAFQQVADAALDLKYSGQAHEQPELAEQLLALTRQLDAQHQQAADWQRQLAELVQQHQAGQLATDGVEEFRWNEAGAAAARKDFQEQLRRCLAEETVLEGLAGGDGDDQQQNANNENTGDAGDGDEDNIEMVGEKLTFRCPITQSRLVEPMRSRVCNHVYEKTAIQTMLARHPTQRCPVGGMFFVPFMYVVAWQY